VSAVSGVVQSHNHSAWEFGTLRAAMLLASRASIVRPCLRPPCRCVWADAIPGKPSARQLLLMLEFAKGLQLAWCPGIPQSPAERDCQLPRLHRASARPLRREEERSHRLACSAGSSGQKLRSARPEGSRPVGHRHAANA